MASKLIDLSLLTTYDTKIKEYIQDRDIASVSYDDATQTVTFTKGDGTDITISFSDLTAAEGAIATIEGKIPSAASSSNQLADKQFVSDTYVPRTRTIAGIDLQDNVTDSELLNALFVVTTVAVDED